MYQELEALLIAWSEWRRDKSTIYRLCGISGSWLGKIVRQRHREIHGDDRPIKRYSDDTMLLIDRLVRRLPRQERRVIQEHYCGPAHWTVEQRAHRLHLGRSWYCELLRSGRDRLIVVIPWSQAIYA